MVLDFIEIFLKSYFLGIVEVLLRVTHQQHIFQ